MTIQNVLKQKRISKYRLAKTSGVPYTTVSDILSGKSQFEKCSAETVFRLARALDVSMEALLEPYLIERVSFDNFKSAVCHQVKELGDIAFVIETLDSKKIRVYYERNWYPESLYLLAMLDYVSRINNIPLCDDYDDLRCCRLEKTVYPSGIRAIYAASRDERVLQQAALAAIPEFMRFNIVENEVRDIV